MTDIAKAVSQAFPDAPLDISGDTIEGLAISNRDGGPVPTEEEIDAAIAAYVAPSPPDWDGFAAWAIANTELNTIAATAISNAPLAGAGLPTALLQVQSGNLANFAATFDAVCTAGSATQLQRDAWADAARDTYSLPADFVAAVRG